MQELNKEEILFPLGLPGFEDIKRFELKVSDEFIPFKLLIPIDDHQTEVKFIIIDTNFVKNDYKIKLKESDLKDLAAEENDVLKDYFIVTLDKSNYNNSYVNLMGPIVINHSKHRAKQIIVEEFVNEPLFYFLKDNK